MILSVIQTSPSLLALIDAGIFLIEFYNKINKFDQLRKICKTVRNY